MPNKDTVKKEVNKRKTKGVSGDRKVYKGPNGGLFVISLCNGEKRKRYIKDDKCNV